ncbi:sensor histidine kinase [Saccharicrinis aurantiacus]|uniref:sensor histidine kinase n=1 Tax=Saccharicrinis aurantiacus TaxID=1849719 RepID=UPI0008387E3B|nr:histidine kinase [Saccharicrinis aurantiacus]
MKNRYNIKLNRALFHALFWSVSILVFAFIFRLSETVDELDLIYSILFHCSIIICVYSNFRGIKKLVNKGRYLSYSIFSILNIVITTILNLYTFNVLVDHILPDYYFVSQFNYIEIGIITLLYLTVTSAIKLSKSWFELQRINQLVTETKKEKIDSELQNLKSQLNPHFLFNSLNVIYSLTLNNDKATSEVVLKLSDILRYVIYDSTKKNVPLSSELSLLKNYIDLQKFRIEDDVTINLTNEIEYDAKVSPLIFLTLLENSFKHGIKNDIEDGFINIYLCSNNKKIIFKIENNKSEIEHNTQKPTGVGLKNIRKRLALEYPDKHKLIFEEKSNKFIVYLEIEHEG